MKLFETLSKNLRPENQKSDKDLILSRLQYFDEVINSRLFHSENRNLFIGRNEIIRNSPDKFTIYQVNAMFEAFLADMFSLTNLKEFHRTNFYN